MVWEYQFLQHQKVLYLIKKQGYLIQVENYYVKFGNKGFINIMSQIGKKPIEIPDGVNINLDNYFPAISASLKQI